MKTFNNQINRSGFWLDLANQNPFCPFCVSGQDASGPRIEFGGIVQRTHQNTIRLYESIARLGEKKVIIAV